MMSLPFVSNTAIPSKAGAYSEELGFAIGRHWKEKLPITKHDCLSLAGLWHWKSDILA